MRRLDFEGKGGAEGETSFGGKEWKLDLRGGQEGREGRVTDFFAG